MFLFPPPLFLSLFLSRESLYVQQYIAVTKMYR